MAAKRVSALSLRRAIYLNSLSLQKKFSIISEFDTRHRNDRNPLILNKL